MKVIIILVTLALLPGTLRSAPGSVHTNVNGFVLELEFYDTTIAAGDFVNAVMTLSNGTEKAVGIRGPLLEGDFRDTSIGDYVVMDANGNVLPKVVWQLTSRPPPLYGLRPDLGSRIIGFPAGAVITSPGDVMKRYCLTNPGTYQVRARAEVPLAMDPMVIETPPIEITVVPRRGTPEPLFTAEELAEIAKLAPFIAGRKPLEVTHPKPEAVTPAPKVAAPAPKVDEPTVAATPKVQGAVAQPASGAVPVRVDEPRQGIGSRSRAMLYGSIVFLGVAALGLVVWRARRKEHAR